MVIEDRFETCRHGELEYEPFFIAEEGYYDEETYRVCTLGHCPYECEKCEYYCKDETTI